jgi:hypothetical protein
MDSSGQDLVVHYIALALSNGCVFFGWMTIMAIGIFGVRRWRAAVLARAQPDEVDTLGGLRWPIYLMSLVIGPAGLVLGLVFLRKPTTARVGANCVYLAFAYFTFCVVAANTAMISAGLLRPEWFVQ